MSITNIFKGNVVTIGFILVIGYCIWKFIIQPKINEGNPIESKEDEEVNMFEKINF